MLVEQISAFLENKPGRFAFISKVLGENDINMQAFTVSESAKFGIAHIIVDNAERAKSVLQENNIGVHVSKVICLDISDRPGEMSKILKLLAENNISVEYMYAYADSKNAHIFLRTDNLELADSILSEMSRG
ncbi:MAG: amino acid-binding protein [Bacteroidaceae bacterium]|nr:amino acid-binding protein [Bacteroidaceae bacterium]